MKEYRAVEHESDEFAVGDIIEINASRLKGKNVKFQPGEVYCVVAVENRWSRWKLEIGKKELEYKISDSRPEGEAWKRDQLIEIHPLLIKRWGNLNLNLKTIGSQRAGSYYFRKSKIKKEEVIKMVSDYFENLKKLILQGEHHGDFKTLCDVLRLTTIYKYD